MEVFKLYAYGGDAILSRSLLALCLRQPLSKHTCNQGTYLRQNARLAWPAVKIPVLAVGLFLLNTGHQPHGYLLSVVNGP